MIIFASLAALTVVTVAVGYLELSIWPALVLALFIASVKSGLVGAHFMHLLTEKKMILHLIILSFVLFLIMVGLFLFAFHDQIGYIGAASESLSH